MLEHFNRKRKTSISETVPIGQNNHFNDLVITDVALLDDLGSQAAAVCSDNLSVVICQKKKIYIYSSTSTSVLTFAL